MRGILTFVGALRVASAATLTPTTAPFRQPLDAPLPFLLGLGIVSLILFFICLGQSLATLLGCRRAADAARARGAIVATGHVAITFTAAVNTILIFLLAWYQTGPASLVANFLQSLSVFSYELFGCIAIYQTIVTVALVSNHATVPALPRWIMACACGLWFVATPVCYIAGVASNNGDWFLLGNMQHFVVCGTLIGLGVFNLKRLRDRLARTDPSIVQWTAPPVALDPPLAALRSSLRAHTRLTGTICLFGLIAMVVFGVFVVARVMQPPTTFVDDPSVPFKLGVLAQTVLFLDVLLVAILVIIFWVPCSLRRAQDLPPGQGAAEAGPPIRIGPTGGPRLGAWTTRLPSLLHRHHGKTIDYVTRSGRTP